MVTQYGMGPTLAVVTPERYAAAGSTVTVDAAVEGLLADAFAAARTLLAGHRSAFDTLVAWLLDDETVDAGRLEQLRPSD